MSSQQCLCVSACVCVKRGNLSAVLPVLVRWGPLVLLEGCWRVLCQIKAEHTSAHSARKIQCHLVDVLKPIKALSWLFYKMRKYYGKMLFSHGWNVLFFWHGHLASRIILKPHVTCWHLFCWNLKKTSKKFTAPRQLWNHRRCRESWWIGGDARPLRTSSRLLPIRLRSRPPFLASKSRLPQSRFLCPDSFPTRSSLPPLKIPKLLTSIRSSCVVPTSNWWARASCFVPSSAGALSGSFAYGSKAFSPRVSAPTKPLPLPVRHACHLSASFIYRAERRVYKEQRGYSSHLSKR